MSMDRFGRLKNAQTASFLLHCLYVFHWSGVSAVGVAWKGSRLGREYTRKLGVYVSGRPYPGHRIVF